MREGGSVTARGQEKRFLRERRGRREREKDYLRAGGTSEKPTAPTATTTTMDDF
jgi:hypothetical protein